GHVLQPVRNMLTIEEGRRYLGVMPAVAEEAMGAKLVSFYPGNAGTALPTHMAMVLLFRPETGEPLAVMDGRLITEMRTAAVSADGILSGALIQAEIGEVFAGTKSVPAGATTVFKSVGLAVEDIAAAKLVYDALAN